MITTLRYTFHLFETTITHYTYGFYNISTGPIGLHRMKNVCMHIFLLNDLISLFFFLIYIFLKIFRHQIFETGVFQINFRTGHVLSNVMKSIMAN